MCISSSCYHINRVTFSSSSMEEISYKNVLLLRFFFILYNNIAVYQNISSYISFINFASVRVLSFLSSVQHLNKQVTCIFNGITETKFRPISLYLIPFSFFARIYSVRLVSPLFLVNKRLNTPGEWQNYYCFQGNRRI